MKSKDFGIIAVVVLASTIISYFMGQLIFRPNERKAQVEAVELLSTEFNTQLDKKYFNPESINPTKLIEIGANSNVNPFPGPPSSAER